MQVTGRFHIKGSISIPQRGLVAIGDIIEGRVSSGNLVGFNTGFKNVTLKIESVEMGDIRSTAEYFVGLTFIYKDENERKEFESLNLKEQVVEVIAGDI